MVGLYTADGQAIFTPVSLRTGQRASFTWQGIPCRLELIALEQHLLGEDAVRLRLVRAEHDVRTAPAAEHAAINALLARVHDARGLVFVRNGMDYSGEQASEFLRRKWERMGDEIRTADDFIRRIASASSITGHPYQVVLANGQTVTLADWLRAPR